LELEAPNWHLKFTDNQITMNMAAASLVNNLLPLPARSYTIPLPKNGPLSRTNDRNRGMTLVHESKNDMALTYRGVAAQ
jgi:hypothetical protein